MSGAARRLAWLCAGVWLVTAPALARDGGPIRPAQVGAARADTSQVWIYRCGPERVEARFGGDTLMLRIGDGPVQRLTRVRAASGARFAKGDLVFHDRGKEALLIRDGVKTTCARRDHGPWRARGQEPGWSATLDGTRMVLELDNGARRIVVPQPLPEERDGGAYYAIRTEAHDITLEVRLAICRDSMSGVPHPETVRLHLDGRTLNGCGGDPAALLQGAAWRVESIGGKPVAGEQPTTINFDDVGRVYGQGPCNIFTGGYSIGEGLVFTPIGTTMRMCAPAAMESEAALHKVLHGTVPFSIAADGALRIGEGPGALVARRIVAVPE